MLLRLKTYSYLILVLTVVLAAPFIVSALTADDIVFPITELGGCGSETECKVYCDEPAHIDQCLDFAETYQLLPQDEIDQARKFQEFQDDDAFTGPGGCDSPESCEQYCNEIAHIDECIAFGEEHNLLDKEELDEARRIQAVLDSGEELPGGCSSKEECDTYCESGNNMRECLAFAEKAGFLEDDELEEIERFLTLLESGDTPGGCQGEEECHEYCEDEAHFDECLVFAEKAGFISEEEAAFARETGGKGPGGCVREECEEYCNDPAHQDECLEFAIEHGFITEEEIQQMEAEHQADVIHQAGPGGCSSKEECETYCRKPEHRAECDQSAAEFADDFEPPFSAEDYVMHIDVVLNDLPHEVRQCVLDEFDKEQIQQIKDEADVEAFEHVIGKCFDIVHEREFAEMRQHEEEQWEEDHKTEDEFRPEYPEPYDERGFHPDDDWKDEKSPEGFYDETGEFTSFDEFEAEEAARLHEEQKRWEMEQKLMEEEMQRYEEEFKNEWHDKEKEPAGDDWAPPEPPHFDEKPFNPPPPKPEDQFEGNFDESGKEDKPADGSVSVRQFFEGMAASVYHGINSLMD